MKRTLVILLVVIVSQLNGFAKEIKNANTESDNYITIIGTLTEMLNGEQVALPFANVYLDGTTEVTTTDFDGEFTIRVKKGYYSLKCTYMGYEVFEQKINTNNDAAIDLKILMRPNDLSRN